MPASALAAGAQQRAAVGIRSMRFVVAEVIMDAAPSGSFPVVGVTMTRRPHGTTTPAFANGSFAAAVESAGATPALLPILEPAAARWVVAGLDALVLSGGEDVNPACYGQAPHPLLGDVDDARDRWELALLAAATRARLPVLGICRGAQVCAVSAGGTLIQHLPDVSDVAHRGVDAALPAHPVHVAPGTQLARIIGAGDLQVNSLHHQAAATLGGGLVASAWSAEGIIEGFEALDGRLLIGVQWHPELRTTDRTQAALFSWLVEAAERHRHGRAA